MKKKILPLSEVYRLIEPGPVVLLSTHHQGIDNVMTMSWHTMLDFNPPLIGCVVSNRNFSFNLLKKSKECVINIPTCDLATKIIECGNVSGKKIDKFKKFKLTKTPALKVKAPLIYECFANLECVVVDMKLANQYNFFVLKVLKSWIDSSLKKNTYPETLHHRGTGVFMIAGKSIKLPSKAK